MNARYYDAGTGKFISQDPAGFGGGDSNLYRYMRERRFDTKCVDDQLLAGRQEYRGVRVQFLVKARETYRQDADCATSGERLSPNLRKNLFCMANCQPATFESQSPTII